MQLRIVWQGALCQMEIGQNWEAIKWLEAARDHFKAVDDSAGLQRCWALIGECYKREQDWRVAARHWRIALRMSTEGVACSLCSCTLKLVFISAGCLCLLVLVACVYRCCLLVFIGAVCLCLLVLFACLSLCLCLLVLFACYLNLLDGPCNGRNFYHCTHSLTFAGGV